MKKYLIIGYVCGFLFAAMPVVWFLVFGDYITPTSRIVFAPIELMYAVWGYFLPGIEGSNELGLIVSLVSAFVLYTSLGVLMGFIVYKLKNLRHSKKMV